MNGLFYKTLAPAALLTALLPFNASANGGNDILSAIKAEVDLRNYQYEATQEICDELTGDVFPVLNALDLSGAFSATYNADRNECRIDYDGRYIHGVQGESLFSLNREFDHERLADSLVRPLSAEDRYKVADALQEFLGPSN